MNKRQRKKCIKEGRKLPDKYIALVVKGNPSSLVIIKNKWNKEIKSVCKTREELKETLERNMEANSIEGCIVIKYKDGTKLNAQRKEGKI